MLPLLSAFRSLLHVRGGVSALYEIYRKMDESSPRAWRCFLSTPLLHHSAQVFSTCVEVFLPSSLSMRLSRGLLHVRGGVSRTLRCSAVRAGSSPRAWRCFPTAPAAWACGGVFSTCVEVFPSLSALNIATNSLLHVRGGVSRDVISPWLLHWSSPRAWRCFPMRFSLQRGFAVFSTCVEVFLARAIGRRRKSCLLHVRGGVSILRRLVRYAIRSSPRAWRCFYRMTGSPADCRVFSTCVEVFPLREWAQQHGIGLLHVRGGVSSYCLRER